MVVLVRHTLLLGSISLDVDDIADTIRDQVCRQTDCAMFCSPNIIQSLHLHQMHNNHTSEAPLEHVARTRAVTERVRHFEAYNRDLVPQLLHKTSKRQY